MKITMPKEITELSASIATARGEIETIKADIARAEQAVQQADGIAAEIDAVSRKRAEQKALAFVSRQPADLAELDRQMAELERANRSALEDGTAASMAVAMLTEKLAQRENAIANMVEARHAQALAWLQDRREKTIDRYIKALVDLGPVIADAAAVDRARGRLGDYKQPYGTWLLEGLKKELPELVPHHRRLPNDRFPQLTLAPITWLRDATHGDDEYAQLIVELQSAGVLSNDIGGGHV